MSEFDPRSMTHAMHRRTVLRGLGAALTLPWLPSAAHAAGEKVSERPPLRWGCVMFANGVNPNHWWAKGSGEQMELSKSLEPLEKVKAKDKVAVKATPPVVAEDCPTVWMITAVGAKTWIKE